VKIAASIISKNTLQSKIAEYFVWVLHPISGGIE